MKKNINNLNLRIAFLLLTAFLILPIKSAEAAVKKSKIVQTKKSVVLNKKTEIKLKNIPDSKFKTDLINLEKDKLTAALSTLNSLGKQAISNDISSLNVDKSGKIFYTCKFDYPDTPPHYQAKDEFPKVPGEPQKADVPISSPPVRHSKPGAANVLYLDFNGGIVNGTAWNSYYGISSWDCKPYDLDGDETTFDDNEQDKIILFWEFVAEDYAPFDVDVTTEEPAVYPARTVGWAMITETTDKNGANCPHYGYGGIAYVNVFGGVSYPYYSPAWVKEYSSTYTAEAAAHELGHNMGLYHDGTSGSAYYHGHYNGLIYWGAIMGGGITPDMSQWSKGEYYDANQTEDDLAIIAGKLGYRTDDHGNNNTTASSLNLVGTNIYDSGYIETTGDPDVFEFMTGAGPVTLNARPYKAASGDWGSNLDILLELQNDSGVIIASNNPPTDVTASISTTLSMGTYFLYVKPTGAGNPMNSTPTGFTIYGSLGSYELTGTINPIPEPCLFIIYYLSIIIFIKRKFILKNET